MKERRYAHYLSFVILKNLKRSLTKKEKLGNINFYYFEPKFSVKSPVCGIICSKDTDQIYIFASPKEGTNKITLSARNTHKKVNTVKLLKAGIKGLNESNAGGHIQAAGGIILAKDLERFKRNIKKFIEKQSNSTQT